MNKMNKKYLHANRDYIYVLSLIAITFLIYIAINSYSPSLLWDENVYLSNARSHIASSNFTEDFRYPGLEYLIASSWTLFGESLLVAKILMILFTTITVYLVYLIARRYMDARYSFFAGILFAISPLMLYWGIRIYTDIPALMFALLSFYLLVLSRDEKGWKRHLLLGLAGISAGISFLIRFVFGIFVCSAVLFLLAKKRFRDLIVFMIIILAVLTPWFVYNQHRYNDPIWDFEEQYSVVERWTQFQPPSRQFSNFMSSNIILLPLLFILGMIMIYRKYDESMLILIYMILSFIYLFFLIRLKDARYLTSMLPFFYILSIYSLYRLIKNKRYPHLGIIMLWIFTIFALMMSYNSIINVISSNNCHKDDSLVQSMNYLEDKLDSNDTIISNIWPWFGYRYNIRVSSPWDPNMSNMIEMYDPKYLIFNNAIGEPYDINSLGNDKRIVLEKELAGKCNDVTYVYRVNDQP